MAKNLADSLNNVLQIIEGRCTDERGEININPDQLSVFEEETSYLRDRLDTSPFQSLIFAVIIQCNAIDRCTVHSVAKKLGMSYLKFLSYASDLYALRDKYLIYQQVFADADRDFWMSADEALRYGMIDKVLINNN